MFQDERTKRMLQITLAFLSLFLIAESIEALQSLRYIGSKYPPQTTISVSGKGQEFAVPDIAAVSFEVREDAKTVPEAQEKVTGKMNSILEALKAAGIEKNDIKTENYSVSPKYEYRRDANCAPNGGCIYPPYPGAQVIVGYEVAHGVLVKIRAVKNAGSILSTLGSLKVSNLGGLVFSIDDEDAIRAAARGKAIAEAREKAKTLAKALGVRLVRVVGFSEGGAYPIVGKYTLAAEARGGAPAATPDIPLGENKITSDVTITYEIR